MSNGSRFGLVLGLLAVTAALVYMGPPVAEGEGPAVLDGMATTLAGWTATDTIVEDLLPEDPHAVARLRRAYRSGPRVAWISVALFTRQDDPRRRPSINRIYPADQVALLERVELEVALDDSAPIALPAAVIHRGDRQLLVVYWHQIGRRVYSSEYRFRWALMRRVLFARRGESVLVRIAVPVTRTVQLTDSLEAAAELAPPLYKALAEALNR